MEYSVNFQQGISVPEINKILIQNNNIHADIEGIICFFVNKEAEFNLILNGTLSSEFVKNSYYYIDVDVINKEITYGISKSYKIYSTKSDLPYSNLEKNYLSFVKDEKQMFYWNGNDWVKCFRLILLETKEESVFFYSSGKSQAGLIKSSRTRVPELNTNTGDEFFKKINQNIIPSFNKVDNISLESLNSQRYTAGKSLNAHSFISIDDNNKIVYAEDTNFENIVGFINSAYSQNDLVVYYTRCFVDLGEYIGETNSQLYIGKNSKITINPYNSDINDPVGFIFDNRWAYIDLSSSSVLYNYKVNY